MTTAAPHVSTSLAARRRILLKALPVHKRKGIRSDEADQQRLREVHQARNSAREANSDVAALLRAMGLLFNPLPVNEPGAANAAILFRVLTPVPRWTTRT
jgi:hypothetical protein